MRWNALKSVKAMKNKDCPDNKELKRIILDQLRKLDINCDALSIEIKNGSTVMLRGEIPNERVRALIKDAITHIPDVQAVVDHLTVVREDIDYHTNSDCDEEGRMLDDDRDFIGTEDVFRSIEDGIPYIPPTSPAYRGTPKDKKWKRKKGT